MQAGTETGRDLPNAGGTAPGSAGLTRERVQLSDEDMRLFMALHRVNAPKQRICSALWLSYAEYDELTKQL